MAYLDLISSLDMDASFYENLKFLCHTVIRSIKCHYLSYCFGAIFGQRDVTNERSSVAHWFVFSGGSS